MSVNDCCGNCRYFRRQIGQGGAVNLSLPGECHRGPPTLIPRMENGQLQIASAFPPTQTGGWCGEFMPPAPLDQG
jgi:hypothetical protein